MKIFTRLEKSKFFWLTLSISVIFFLFRLPSVIEPYWYGDEGIYEAIGQAMNHGRLLYHTIWDNKPPLLYVIYAIANGDQTMIRFFSLFAGLFSLVFLLLFIQKLFRSYKITTAVGLFYTILFATPLIEGNIANAENFLLLPILAGAYVFYNAVSKQNTKQLPDRLSLFIPGLLIGIAFLLKIVAVFDFISFALFLVFLNLQKTDKKYLRTELPVILKSLSFYVIGFLIPLGVTVVYFFIEGGLKDFIEAVFFGNISYVGYANTLYGIPQGLLILKVVLLVLSLGVIFFKRNSVSITMLFITLWVVFSLFNTFFSGRPYTHYFLVMLPSLCLLFGLFLASKKKYVKLGLLLGILVILGILQFQFKPNISKSFLYYENAIQFLNGTKDVLVYQSFFDPKTPRDYAVTAFITTHTEEKDTVFIWGNNAQIYAMSHKIPPTKYTVAYHIDQNQVSLQETEDAVNHAQPKYIIVLSESQPLPFSVPLYIMRFNLEGATIYERTL